MKKVYKPVIEHQHHKLAYVKGPNGPHIGKFVCIDCNKFIKWAKPIEVKIYEKILTK